VSSVAQKVVEDKQGWSNDVVKTLMWLAGTTRREIREQYARDARDLVAKKGLSDPKDIVPATVAMIRQKQGWDRLLKE